MTLKDLYTDYQNLNNKLSLTTLLSLAGGIFFILMLILLTINFNIFQLILFIFSCVILLVLFILTKKLVKKVEKLFVLLEKIKIENSCEISKGISSLDIPTVYNIVETIKTKDGFKLYKCKNSELEYDFLEQAVKTVDNKNNMLSIIEFTNLEVGSIVTIEYIMKNNLCIIKDKNSKLSLCDLSDISLRGDYVG